MNSNIEKIIADIRSKRYLDHPSQEGLTTTDIIDAINDVQGKIFSQANIEKIFDIHLKKNINSYDIASRESLKIKKIFTSWNGTFEIKDNIDWNEDVTGNYPLYGTIFGQRLKISPAPADNGNTIEIWAYQTGLITAVDEEGEIDIEIPSNFTLALKLGVCAEFEPERFELKFREELKTQISNYHVKETRVKSAYPNW